MVQTHLRHLNHDSLDSRDYLDYLNHGNPKIPQIMVQTSGEARKPVHTDEPAFDLTVERRISLRPQSRPNVSGLATLTPSIPSPIGRGDRGEC